MLDFVISVGQGQSSDVCAGMDVAGARQIADTLARSGLTAKYNVCVGLNFNMNWLGAVGSVLDEFCNRGLYFVADAISSDTLAGAYLPNNFQSAYAAAYGVARCVGQYSALLARYGSWFRGLRFHEVLTHWGAMTAAFPDGPGWWKDKKERIPPRGKFYNRDFAEDFVGWCHTNGRPLFWSEPVTSGMANPGMAPLEAEVVALTNLYPATIVPVWANNVAGAHATGNAWNYLRPLFTNNTRGWGLSAQAWGNPGGKVTGQEGVLLRKALDGGAVAALVEPLWGWIRWPEATWSQASDADVLRRPEWADRGAALASLQSLVAPLLA